MKQQIKQALQVLKAQDIDGCITGSVMLDYFPGQDIDVFTYNKQSFVALLYFMKYNKMFTCLEPLEKHKLDDFLKNDRSSLSKLHLITIKFKWNLCIDINVIYKEFHKDIFSVLSNFDLDIIAQGYDIKTGKILNLRETKGKKGTWNRWNPTFRKVDFWSCKKLLRQWERILKYEKRGYDLSSVTNKYIELVEEILKLDNIYKTERGTLYFEENIKQFEVVLKILKAYKKEKKISPEGLNLLKTLI